MPAEDKVKISSDFAKAYAEAVEEAMLILGEGAHLITDYLEQKYSIKLADTADTPKALSEALTAALDESRRIIERRILRLLYAKLNMRLQSSINMDFEEKIRQAREMYEKLGSSHPSSNNND